jgi:hypothetical protein
MCGKSAESSGPGPVTLSVRTLLESLDARSESDRVEAAVEILRRMTSVDAELPEQAPVEAGDMLFSPLDAEERGAAYANRQSG